LFLGFGYKVNVRFNFRSRQTQAGMQVSSAIKFRMPMFNRVIIQKALSQITNMQHIFSAKSLKRGNCPVAPWFEPGYSSIISKRVPRFKNAFPWYFTYVFSCWCCNASLRRYKTDVAKRRATVPVLTILTL